jgi:GDPmannose 4,6-dehydratase
VEAIWWILQQDKPDDYLVAIGETHTVEEFSEVAFARVGLDPKKQLAFDGQLQKEMERRHIRN